MRNFVGASEWPLASPLAPFQAPTFYAASGDDCSPLQFVILAGRSAELCLAHLRAKHLGNNTLQSRTTLNTRATACLVDAGHPVLRCAERRFSVNPLRPGLYCERAAYELKGASVTRQKHVTRVSCQREVEAEVEAEGDKEKIKTIAQQNALSDFDSFWAFYPKKVGKPAAKKAWRGAHLRIRGSSPCGGGAIEMDGILD